MRARRSCCHACDLASMGVAVCSILQLFPQHVSTTIATWGLELIDWICIKMKDNEVHEIHSHLWASRAENYRVILADVEVDNFITKRWPYQCLYRKLFLDLEGSKC